MDRGIYDILLKHPIYQNSKKDWIIETARSDMIGYDLMFDPFDELETRPMVLNQLKQFKKDVESSIEKRFIYFICTRKKFDSVKISNLIFVPNFQWLSSPL